MVMVACVRFFITGKSGKKFKNELSCGSLLGTSFRHAC